MALFKRSFQLAWSLLTWITFSALVAALCVGWYYYQRVDEEIRSLFEARLSAHYKHLDVRLGSARLLKGEGLRLLNLELSQPNASGASGVAPLVRIDEIIVKGNPNLSELLHGNLSVQQIQVRGLKLWASRGQDGQWDIATLWPLPQFTPPPAPLPEVILEKAQIELRDGSSRTTHRLRLRDLHARLRMKRLPEQRADAVLIGVQGALTTDHCRQITFQGAARTSDGAWSLKGAVDRLQWSPSFLSTLPAELATSLQRLSGLRASTGFDFHVNHSPTSEETQYWLGGKVYDGRWQADSSQVPISNLQAEYQVDQQGLLVPRFSARVGKGQVTGSLRATGHDLTGPFTLSLAAEQVEFTPRFVKWLPAQLQEGWQKCQIAGQFSGQLELLFDGTRWDTTADLTGQDLTLLHRQFPYPVTQCQGSIQFQQQLLSFDLTGMAGSTPITMKGSIRQPGPRATGWWEVKSSRWKQIDDVLLAALPKSVQQFLARLRLHGQIGFWARFDRETPTDDPMTPHLVLAIDDGWVNYDAFPYPIGDIQGRIECRDGRWRFLQLQGWNDGCRIECNGVWMADQPQRPLRLEFRAQDVIMDSDLQRAIPPTAQRLWHDLQLQGTLDELAVDLQYLVGSARPQLQVRARQAKRPNNELHPTDLRLQPVWFPYRIDNVTGELRWANDQLSIQDLAGQHGKTRLRANVTADLTQPQRWRLQFTDLAVDGLRADEDFLSALPPRQAEILRQRQVEGTFSLAGALHLTRPGAGLPVTSGWDLLLNAEEAGWAAGLPIQHAFGQARLRGHFDGKQFWSRGTLEMDSLICRNLQVTRLRGPLWIDSQRLLLGDRVPRDSTPDDPKPLIASVYNGQLAVNAEVSLDPESRFDLQANLTSAEVANIARDAQLGQGNLAGQAYLELLLSGSARGRHTLKGRGSAHLRNANLYELPLVLALLNLMSSGKRNTAAFSSSDVSFQVRGGHVYFDRFDLGGDAITLKGIGEMGLDRRLNLDFYSIVGREQLWSPIVRPILGEASRQFLRIHVDGTLEHPVTTQEVLPGLNGTLQQLFPELTPTARSESKPETSRFSKGRPWWDWTR